MSINTFLSKLKLIQETKNIFFTLFDLSLYEMRIIVRFYDMST